MNLAIKARRDEALLLRRVGSLFAGGFSAWARALLLREAVREAERAGISTDVDSAETKSPPRRERR